MEVAVITEICDDQACISVWDFSTAVRLKTYKNCKCARNGLDFVTNNYIVSAQHNSHLLHVYDTQNERLVKRIVCSGKISSLAISPDGNYCVVALMEKLHIWQISNGNLINVISKHYQNITSIKFTTDGMFFVTCGDDNIINIWNFANTLQPRDAFNDTDICDEPYHSLNIHSMPIRDLHVGVNGMRCCLVTCSLDQTCKMVDLCSGQTVCTFVFDRGCTAVTMDVVERNMFVGTLDGSIYFIDCHSKSKQDEIHVPSEKKGCLKAHEKCVNLLAVTMDGTKLISGSLDCNVKIWHINNQQCLKSFSFKGEISNVLIKPFANTFEWNKLESSTKVKPSIGSFKRSVFVPGNYTQLMSDPSAENDEALTPIILKAIDTKCMLTNNTFSRNDNSLLINKVLAECVAQKSDLNYLDPKTATRAELLESVKELESMTKEIYQFAKEKLLMDLSNPREEKEEQAELGDEKMCQDAEGGGDEKMCQDAEGGGDEKKCEEAEEPKEE